MLDMRAGKPARILYEKIMIENHAPITLHHND